MRTHDETMHFPDDASNSRPGPGFSLLFFASEQAVFSRGNFDLFRESATFADEHGFEDSKTFESLEYLDPLRQGPAA